MIFLALLIASTFGAIIESLPGLQGPVNFTQYGGYIEVDPIKGRRLFYWAVASQRSPETDPVVLWLTGGPGCSGLEVFFHIFLSHHLSQGLLGENGPFHPADDEGNTLYMNPYSWNRIATVIYVESPAGVGFSECDDPSDLNTGDARTTEDLVSFLKGFFKELPRFYRLPFYITGESYAGHYVPNLALALAEAGQNSPTPNFKGFMVGNAWTDVQADMSGSLFDWYSHSLISTETYDNAMSSCDFTHQSAECDKWLDQAHSEMGAIDIYSIYTPTCQANDDPQSSTLRTLLSKKSAFKSTVRTFNPCMTNAVTSYVNRADVQAAIHAHPKQWQMCGGVNYNQTDAIASILPVWRKLLKDFGSLQYLVYSGDCDGNVPTPGTRFWLEELGLNQKNAWRPWYSEDHQVGGYITEFKELIFSTVRGSGHMVPYFQPERAWVLFSAFIEGRSP